MTAHVGVLALVLLATPQAPTVIPPPAVVVRLTPPFPEPEPPGTHTAASESAPEPAKASVVASTPQRARAAAPSLVAPPALPAVEAEIAAVDASRVSGAELVGAARAGGLGVGAGDGQGQGAGRCDMLARLEAGLRRDARVRAAVDRAASGEVRAIRVWNGAWVRHPGEAGGGLAAVREAILWEVGFAPEACRAQPVRGLVQVALGDAPGDPRLVLGAGAWRWSDLLGVRTRG